MQVGTDGKKTRVSTRSGKPDLRRMRAAALSIIPNSTGAARAIGLTVVTA